MTHYIAYWPETDAIDNCGFLMEIADFHPAAYKAVDEPVDIAREDADMRSATSDTPTAPFEAPVTGVCPGAVCLPVPCAGPGFTWAELRAAADAWRAANGSGCWWNPDPRTPETPLCRAATTSGLCADHAAVWAGKGGAPCP